MTETEMLHSMARYCSRAERCTGDVRKKITAAGLSDTAAKRIIDSLRQDKFLDDARYSRGFVRDKFRFNHWGRVKILYELKAKGIKAEHCYGAMEEIDEKEYVAKLMRILKDKHRTVKADTQHDLYAKLYRFALSRGFEPQLVSKALKDILKTAVSDEDI